MIQRLLCALGFHDWRVDPRDIHSDELTIRSIARCRCGSTVTRTDNADGY